MTTKKTQKPEVDPVRPTMPTITIGEKTYTLKRLPASMAFDLLPLIETLFGLFRSLTPEQRGGPIELASAMGQHAIYTIRHHRNLLIDVFAHALGVKAADFNDGEQFPLSTHVKLVNALAEHPDLLDFFTQAHELWSNARVSLPTETASPESSSPSEPEADTPGGETSSS